MEGPRVQKAEGIEDLSAVARHAECHEKVSANHDGHAMIAPFALPAHVTAAPLAISTPPRTPMTCASPGPAAVAASGANAGIAITSAALATPTACRSTTGTVASVPTVARTANSNGFPEMPTDVVPSMDVVPASIPVARGSWPPLEDDDYDPAKPEYMIPIASEDCAREEARMLDMQIAALERRLHREDGDSNKKVTDHYLDVVDILRRSRMEAQQLAGPWAGGIPEEQPRAQVN